MATHLLVTSRAERIDAILWRWTVASQQHHTDLIVHPSISESINQLINGLRAKSVAYLGSVERDADDTVGPVVGDVAVFLDLLPGNAAGSQQHLQILGSLLV